MRRIHCNNAQRVQTFCIFRFFFILYFILHSFSVFSQIRTVHTFVEDPDHVYFIEEVPLPSTIQEFNAISIIQDRDGFMWFGGETGLLRYDGSRIREYFFDPNDDSSIRFNRINAIVQDSAGIIWLASFRGLIRLDPRSNSFKTYPHAGIKDQALKWGLMRDMVLDNDKIWIAAGYGFCMFDIQTGTFSRHHRFYNPTESEAGLENRGLAVSLLPEDKLCIRFGAQVYMYDIIQDSTWLMPDAPPSFSKSYTDHKAEIYFPSWTGLFKYSPGEKKFERIDLGLSAHNIHTSEISAVVQGSDGYYWINTPSGIGMYTNTWQPLRFWQYTDIYFSGIGFDQFRAMFIDRNNIIWFSTPGKIHRIIKKPRVFHCDTRPPLQSFMIYLTVKDSCYWFTDLYSNVYKVNYDLSDIKRYNLKSASKLNDSSPALNFFLFDRSGRMWIGSENEGVFRCDNISSNKPVFTHLYPGIDENPDIPGQRILNIYEDSLGRAWFATRDNRACYVDPRNDDLIYTAFDKINSRDPIDVKVESELGNEWFLASHRHGVVIFCLGDAIKSGDTLHIRNYEIYNLRNENTKETIIPYQISTTKDDNGRIQFYVVSNRGGIHRYVYDPTNTKGEKIIKNLEINTNNGLVTNTFSNIVEDKNGIMWFGSEDGLVRYNPEQESFTTYTRYEGLEYDEFQNRSVAEGSDGRFYYGTDFGLLSFNPDSVILNKSVPPVIITDVKVNGISLLEDTLASVSFFKRERFKLNYKQNNLTFEFAVLNYIHPKRNHFKIQLQGLDEKYVHVGSESMYSYYNLRPGNYSFHVIGSNNDDVWNMAGDQFDFVLRKPPWFTWGAWLIYLLILAVLAYISYRFVLYRTKNRMAIEKERIEKQSIAEVDDLKSRFFANISHEFRTPLTLIMGHVRDLEKQQGSERKIKDSSLAVLGRNARRLLLLINQLLDIAKLEKNALELELKKGDLSEWIRVLVSSFQSLADSQEIQFIAKIDDPEKEVCFDPDKTEKIVTNLLSNAFKFTEKGGKVAFSLHYFNGQDNEKEYVEIVVKDSGKGMDEEELSRIFDRFYQSSFNDTRSAEGSGIGLSLTKELVELLQGTITVESAPGKGTAFKVMLPVSEECFPEEEIQMSDTSETIQANLVVEDEVPDLPSEEGEVPAQKPVTLVVEDNPDLRKYLLDQLKVSYRVLEAEDGRKGLEQAKQHLPDLVITDLMMPVMSGLEMMQALKQDPATNHIPVIMLTAKADMQSKLEGLELGADDYIIKPFDSEELRVRVRNLIRQRAQLREKFAHDFLLASESDEGALHYNTLRGILDIIHHHLEDAEFNMNAFGRELGMTRSQLFRKIRLVTNTTPNELVKIVRMKRAAQLLRSTDLNVTQVMYEVGMQNPSHFAKSFKKYYNVNPAKYRKRH